MVADDIRMKRKIQQLGSSTLAVTLPAEWAREHGAEKGDELIIQRDESGGSLLIVPDSPKTADESAVIDADALDGDALERAILAQYVLGRQLIRVESDESLPTDAFDAISDVERQLMGLGVVEQSGTYVDVRCSVAPGDFELPTLLERLWRTEATMREHAVDALCDGDPDSARRTIHHQRQIEKLFYLFLRLVFTTYRNPRLNESVGLETGFPLIGYRSVAQDVALMDRSVAQDVALMAEHARRIATMVVDRDDPTSLDEPATAQFRDVAAVLDDAADATRAAVTDPTQSEISRARDALDLLPDAVATAQTYLEDERPAPLLTLQRSLTALRSSGDHTADSLDVAGHFAFRSQSSVETVDESDES